MSSKFSNNRGYKNRKNNKQKNKGRLLKDGTQIGDLGSVIPRTLQPASLFPAEMTRTLEFRPLINVIATGAQSYMLAEFKLNSPYDPEYATGGAQPSGFATLMNAYNYCIVEGTSAQIEVTNREPDVNIICGWILRDAQPSSIITTYASAVSSFNIGPRVAPKLLTFNTGSDKVILKQPYIPLSAIIGNPLSYQGGLTFICPANTDPSQLVWGAFVAYSETDGITMPNGLSYLLSIKMKIRFFSLRVTVP